MSAYLMLYFKFTTTGDIYATAPCVARFINGKNKNTVEHGYVGTYGLTMVEVGP